MLLAEMTVRQKTLSSKRTTELEDRLESFLAALIRNGQIGRRWVWDWVKGQLKVTLSTPRPDGLSPAATRRSAAARFAAKSRP